MVVCRLGLVGRLWLVAASGGGGPGSGAWACVFWLRRAWVVGCCCMVCWVVGVGRSAGSELGAGTGGHDGRWSAWRQSPCEARKGQWSSGGELGIDLPPGGSVADWDSALYREGVIRAGGACVAVSMGLAGSVRSHTDGVSLRGVHRPGGQGIPWRSHPFRRDPLLPLTVRC